MSHIQDAINYLVGAKTILSTLIELRDIDILDSDTFIDMQNIVHRLVDRANMSLSDTKKELSMYKNRIEEIQELIDKILSNITELSYYDNNRILTYNIARIIGQIDIVIELLIPMKEREV